MTASLPALQVSAIPKIAGRWLLLSRLVWILLALVALSYYLVALPNYHEGVVSLSNLSFGFTEGWTPELFNSALANLGVTPHWWAMIHIFGTSIFAGMSFLIGVLVFIRKSDEPMAFFTSLLLVLLGAFFNNITAVLEPYLVQPWHTLMVVFALSPFVCFFLMFYVFPDGRFVPNWTRWLAPFWIVINVGAAFFPGTLADLNSWPMTIQFPTLVLLPISFIYAQIYRYLRVSDPVARQQTKGVVVGLSIALLGFVSAGLADTIFPALQQHNEIGLSYELFANLISYLTFMLVPVTFGLAILRYRLWNIEPVLNRTLVYGALTACVIGIYAVVVAYFSAFFQLRDNPVVSLIAAGVVAVLFQPLRDRLQRLINRLMYGERDDPYTVVERLGQRLEAALSPEAVLPAVVETVGEALKLPRAAIWLVEGDGLRLGAISSGETGEMIINDAKTVQEMRAMSGLQSELAVDHASPFGLQMKELGAMLVLPLTNRGELVGVLCLAGRSPGEPFTTADRRLLHDLARGAGPAVQAAQLTLALQEKLEELRISRERLLNAQEEERRRIQRDLHDGLGPVLASMRLRLEACLDQASSTSPELIYELERLDELVGQASQDIRELVYDLRPPVLDQLGLVPALRQHVERFSRETSIAVDWSVEDDIGMSAASETAIFRIVQEALLNIQKYARASKVSIELLQEKYELILLIQDNGVGFDTGGADHSVGTGLGNMHKRAEMLGGKFCLSSQVGVGTELEVRIPVER